MIPWESRLFHDLGDFLRRWDITIKAGDFDGDVGIELVSPELRFLRWQGAYICDCLWVGAVHSWIDSIETSRTLCELSGISDCVQYKKEKVLFSQLKQIMESSSLEFNCYVDHRIDYGYYVGYGERSYGLDFTFNSQKCDGPATKSMELDEITSQTCFEIADDFAYEFREERSLQEV